MSTLISTVSLFHKIFSLIAIHLLPLSAYFSRSGKPEKNALLILRFAWLSLSLAAITGIGCVLQLIGYIGAEAHPVSYYPVAIRHFIYIILLIIAIIIARYVGIKRNK